MNIHKDRFSAVIAIRINPAVGNSAYRIIHHYPGKCKEHPTALAREII
jgi:hypothetical protein